MNTKKIFIATLILVGLIGTISPAESGVYIEVFQNETRVMKFEGLSRMAVGNPKIADVNMFAENADEVMINGKAPGVTTLSIWKKDDVKETYIIHVSVGTATLERKTYPLKHYELSLTEYDQKESKIITKIDEASVANLRAMLEPIVGEKNFSVDATRNRVLMQGTKEDLDTATALLQQIDEPLRQVMIEAKIIEITKGDLKKMGASLLAQQNESRGETMGLSDTLNFTFDTFTDLARRFKITLDTLREEQVGRTLVNPKIAVLDGKTAWILAGEKLPVASRDSDKGLVSYDYISTGIILAVTPRVGYDNTITLWLKPEVSNVTGWVGDPNSATSGAAPIIDTREVMSEIRVADGESILIGGLQKDYEITTRNKVPVLGDLPVVGSAFRKKRTEVETSELLIVITPHIMTDEKETEMSVVPEETNEPEETPEEELESSVGDTLQTIKKSSLLSFEDMAALAMVNGGASTQSAAEGE